MSMHLKTAITAASRINTTAPAALATVAAPIPASLDQYPDCALLRESQLVPSPKRPGAMALLPFSAPTLWRKVKAGDFPKPLKLGPRITAWRCGDIRQWLAQQESTNGVQMVMGVK